MSGNEWHKEIGSGNWAVWWPYPFSAILYIRWWCIVFGRPPECDHWLPKFRPVLPGVRSSAAYHIILHNQMLTEYIFLLWHKISALSFATHHHVKSRRVARYLHRCHLHEEKVSRCTGQHPGFARPQCWDTTPTWLVSGICVGGWSGVGCHRTRLPQPRFFIDRYTEEINALDWFQLVSTDWDVRRYADHFGVKYPGTTSDREETMQKRFKPLKTNHLEITPCTITDRHGRLLVWYLPNILRPERQVLSKACTFRDGHWCEDRNQCLWTSTS